MLLGREKVWWLFFIRQEDSHVQNVRSFPEERRSLDSVARSDRRTAANKENRCGEHCDFGSKIPISNEINISAKFKAESSNPQKKDIPVIISLPTAAFLRQNSRAKSSLCFTIRSIRTECQYLL